MLWIALLAATPAFEGKVLKSMAAQREDAAQVFNDVWKGSITETMTASQARSYALWITIGGSIRLCKAMASASLQADWKTAIDRINWGYGPAAEGVRAAAVQRAAMFLDEPEVDDPLAELTAKEKAGLCAVELEASRRLLLDM